MNGYDKKKTGPITATYIEVNHNPLTNAGCYTLEDGSNVFDIAIIFAANMGIHPVTGYTVLKFNPEVMQVLNDAANTIVPLQLKGIKVLLSVLGNHEPVGISNFLSESDAKSFANDVYENVTMFGLDGVDLDDEYSDYPEGTVSDKSIRWLVSALREKMPHKIISLYAIRPAATGMEKAPAQIGAKLSYAWNPNYGSFWPPEIPGLTAKSLAPAAINLQQTSAENAEFFAQKTVDRKYGAFLTYDLNDTDQSDYLSTFTKVLYKQKAIYHNPHFADKFDAITPTSADFNNEFWIFNGMNYIQYSKSTAKIIRKSSIWAGWRGLRGKIYETGVDAIAMAERTDQFWIFKDNRCTKYSVVDNTLISEGTIGDQWPALKGTVYESGIDAITPTDTWWEYWIFKGDRYVRYSKYYEKVQFNKTISNGWPGLAGTDYSKHIDAMCPTGTAGKFWIFNGDKDLVYNTSNEQIASPSKYIIYDWQGLVNN